MSERKVGDSVMLTGEIVNIVGDIAHVRIEDARRTLVPRVVAIPLAILVEANQVISGTGLVLGTSDDA
jgi:hypothetical protein